MEDKTLCPLCGEGYVTPRTESMQTEYRGKQGTVMLRYAECDACGSEITGDADGRANKRAVLAFRKSVDGLLTGAEIRALREKFGITQEQASRLFGGGPKAFSKYEADDVAHSEAMNNLLCLVQTQRRCLLGSRCAERHDGSIACAPCGQAPYDERADGVD
jgi:HTH-type transcriptional regulator/antitoxin MqsA